MAVDSQWTYMIMIIIRRIVGIVSQKLLISPVVLRCGGRVLWNGGGIGRRRPATLIIKEASIGTSPNERPFIVFQNIH